MLANTQASQFGLISAMLKTRPSLNTLAAEQAHPGQLGARNNNSSEQRKTLIDH